MEMTMWFLYQLVFAFMLGSTRAESSQFPCNPTKAETTCNECINSGPGCAWCKQMNFSKEGETSSSRCDSLSNLIARKCKRQDIINPQSELSEIVNDPFQIRKDNVIQIKPQKIRLALRRGLPKEIAFKFKRAEGYPIDLYYLMDLSYSMKDDLEKVKSLGKQLLDALTSVTKSIQIGFGSFVDKTVLPFVNTNKEKMKNPCPTKSQKCQPPFDFKHVLKLTNNADTFNTEVQKQHISGNLDPPEAGLDAMMQAAVCGDIIGWRNVTRLLVYTSDDGFHFAGDGKLGAILNPNDGKCHLNSLGFYEDSHKYDYPSIAELAQKLAENNIQPIFAVTSKIMPIYQELSKMIPKSAVGELKEDSSNVVQLIKDAYNNLSSKVIMKHNNLPDGVRIEYKSKCSDGENVNDKNGTCSNVKIGEEVEFIVTITAEKCLDKTYTFEIRPLGFTDKLEIELRTECNCNCDDSFEMAEHCNKHGSIKCGICSCTNNRIGQFCECDPGQQSTQELVTACHRDNSSASCSNQGDCFCGRCTCHTSPKKKIYGQFCECDNVNCELNLGKLCGGHGTCDCGTCKCNSGFSGSACQCPQSDQRCKNNNGRICSGRGTCECNQCKCNTGYEPPHCKECPACPSPCPKYIHCVECLGFDSGPYKDNCTASCTNIKHNKTGTVKQKPCKEKSSKDCWIIFSMTELDGVSQYEVVIRKEQDCPKPPNIAAIIGGGVSGVLLIGLAILLIWKLITELYDRKEFRRFEQEKTKAKWQDGDNPLFQTATTTVINPLNN
uniref:Integrin beta n=1 Tax=Callorhinchus milii TaxID=7868 RepID=A0A4W3HCJ1_CALMI|eukprot:gi/632946998/ref/XP_007888838.1/ PREDICTED: integrin beta-2 isoform X2 [Callorhinchus milii]